MRKFNDGFYVLLTIAAEGSLIGEIERRLRVSEQVIKFITVRMDEEEKRLAKVKALRDRKVKRSAQPVAAPVQQLLLLLRLSAVAEVPAAETRAAVAVRLLPRLQQPQRFSFCAKDSLRIAMLRDLELRCTRGRLPHTASAGCLQRGRLFRDTTRGLEQARHND